MQLAQEAYLAGEPVATTPAYDGAATNASNLPMHGGEVWPVLLPFRRDIRLPRLGSDNFLDPITIRSARADPAGPDSDCLGISALVEHSLRTDPRFADLSPTVRERYIEDHSPDMVRRTIARPDTIFAGVATNQSEEIIGYVALRYGTHRFAHRNVTWRTVPGVGEVTSLHTSPNFFRLGRWLLGCGEMQARAAGIGKITIEANKGSVKWLTEKEKFYEPRRSYSVDERLAAEGIFTPIVYLQRSFHSGVAQATLIKPDKVEPRSMIDLAGMQYDRPAAQEWRGHSDKNNPNRQLFLAQLQPHLQDIKDRHVLEIGGGIGWLSDEIRQNQGYALCLEPSGHNVADGRKLYPYVEFAQTSLANFQTDERFDMAFAVMVDNFTDLEASLRKVRHLLKPGGTFITIISDYKRTVRGRPDYEVKVDNVTDESGNVVEGEKIVHINFPGKYGELWVVARTVDRYTELAERAKLTLRRRTPIYATLEHPHWGNPEPLFHQLEFKA